MATSTTFFLSSLLVSKPQLQTTQTPLTLKPTNAITTPTSVSFSFLKRFESLSSSSRFVRRVAVSSEVDEDVYEDEDGEEDEDEEEEVVDNRQFSPDLKLFVGNLPFSADSSSLAGLFQSAGNVEMVEVVYDRVTGRSRGFGFVTMSTKDEVLAAEERFNGYEFEGRPLRVNAGPPPPKDSAPRFGRGDSSPRFGGAPRGAPDGNKLHISNLSWGVDDAALKNLFSEQGEVLEAKVIYDRDSGRSRGFGFVTLSSADEVANAIEMLDGADLDGRPIRVSAAEARQRRPSF